MERPVNDVDTTIRSVLNAHGRLATPASGIKDDDDLYQKGLSSHASVNVMLAIEDAFDVEIPDSLLTRATFRSIGSIAHALAVLGVACEPSE